MTVHVTSEAEPVPSSWRDQPPLALQPGQTARLGFNGETRYLHCLAPGSYVVTLTRERPPGAPEEPLAALYGRLWGLLFGARDASPEEQARVLAEVERDLPRQCGCSWSWGQWKKAHPPKFGADFFEYLVDAKNEIRRRQRKSTVTLAEVRALYGASAGG